MNMTSTPKMWQKYTPSARSTQGTQFGVAAPGQSLLRYAISHCSTPTIAMAASSHSEYSDVVFVAFATDKLSACSRRCVAPETVCVSLSGGRDVTAPPATGVSPEPVSSRSPASAGAPTAAVTSSPTAWQANRPSTRPPRRAMLDMHAAVPPSAGAAQRLHKPRPRLPNRFHTTVEKGKPGVPRSQLTSGI
jgi:hypothetical protein